MSQSEYDIRRKKSGNANKKNQQTTNGHPSHCDTKIEEQKTILPEKTTEKECSRQQENLPRKEIPSPSSPQIDDDPQSFTLVKQRNRNRLSNPPISSETSTPPITNGKYHDNHFKPNGQILPSYPMCTYAPHNPLPPRFRQQQQQQQQQQQPKETVFSNSRFRRRRGGGGGRFAKRLSYPPDSMRYSNDFVPTSEEQEQIQEEQVENQEIESPTESRGQQDLSTTNGYSSESDILTGKIQSIISNLSSCS